MNKGISLGGKADKSVAGAWVAETIAAAFAGEPLIAPAKAIPDPVSAFREHLNTMMTSAPRSSGWGGKWDEWEISLNERSGDWRSGRTLPGCDLPDGPVLLKVGPAEWSEMWASITFQQFGPYLPDTHEWQYRVSGRGGAPACLRVPRKLGKVDAALFLAASGTAEAKVPLGLAVAMNDSSRPIDPFGLDEVARRYCVARAVEGPAPEWWGLSWDSTDQCLCTGGTWGNSPPARVLAPLFGRREGREPRAGGRPWAYLLRDESTLLTAEPPYGDCTELTTAAARYGYELKWVGEQRDLLDEVEELLARARTGAAKRWRAHWCGASSRSTRR